MANEHTPQIVVLDATGEVVPPVEREYRIDFSKVQTVDDMKAIFELLDLRLVIQPDTVGGQAVLASAGGAFLSEVRHG